MICHSFDMKSIQIGISLTKTTKDQKKSNDDDPNIYEFSRYDAPDSTLLNLRSNFEKTVDNYNYYKYIANGISKLSQLEDLRNVDEVDKNAGAPESISKGKNVKEAKKKTEKAEIVPEGEMTSPHLVICCDNHFHYPALSAAIKKVFPALESISQDFSKFPLILQAILFCVNE